MRKPQNIRSRHLIAAGIAFLVLLFLVVFAVTSGGHSPAADCEGRIDSIIKFADGDRSTAYGHTYGPRERRESLMFWSERGEFGIQHDIHGPPIDPLDSRGPLIETHTIRVPRGVFEDLPEIAGRVLAEAEDGVKSVP